MSLTLSSQSLLRTAQAVAFAGLFALGVACSMTGGIEASPAGETELPRIVAAGDFHGDYDAFESVITGAGLVDETGKWKAGDTIFIQLGDLPDRGPDTRQIIDRKSFNGRNHAEMRQNRHWNRPVEEKESLRWIDVLQHCHALEVGQTRLTKKSAGTRSAGISNCSTKS